MRSCTSSQWQLTHPASNMRFSKDPETYRTAKGTLEGPVQVVQTWKANNRTSRGFAILWTANGEGYDESFAQCLETISQLVKTPIFENLRLINDDLARTLSSIRKISTVLKVSPHHRSAPNYALWQLCHHGLIANTKFEGASALRK
jgi:hypothetical protein